MSTAPRRPRRRHPQRLGAGGAHVLDARDAACAAGAAPATADRRTCRRCIASRQTPNQAASICLRLDAGVGERLVERLEHQLVSAASHRSPNREQPMPRIATLSRIPLCHELFLSCRALQRRARLPEIAAVAALAVEVLDAVHHAQRQADVAARRRPCRRIPSARGRRLRSRCGRTGTAGSDGRRANRRCATGRAPARRRARSARCVSCARHVGIDAERDLRELHGAAAAAAAAVEARRARVVAPRGGQRGLVVHLGAHAPFELDLPGERQVPQVVCVSARPRVGHARRGRAPSVRRSSSASQPLPNAATTISAPGAARAQRDVEHRQRLRAAEVADSLMRRPDHDARRPAMPSFLATRLVDPGERRRQRRNGRLRPARCRRRRGSRRIVVDRDLQ